MDNENTAPETGATLPERPADPDAHITDTDAYIAGKRARAAETWKGVDPDEYMQQVRGGADTRPSVSAEAVAARILEEHRKYAIPSWPVGEWAMIAAKKVLATMREVEDARPSVDAVMDELVEHLAQYGDDRSAVGKYRLRRRLIDSGLCKP